MLLGETHQHYIGRIKRDLGISAILPNLIYSYRFFRGVILLKSVKPSRGLYQEWSIYSDGHFYNDIMLVL
jgi:hypothetical protein